MLERGSSYDAVMAGFRWILPERYNMAEAACDQWALRDPDRVALLDRRRDGAVETWTYLRLMRQSMRLANVLEAHGIRPGDRVAILLPQSPATAIAHFACYRMGAIAVPLALLFGAEALTWRLADSGARAVVTTSAGAERLAALRDRLPDLAHVFCVEGAGDGAADLGLLMERAADRHAMVASGPDDPALMIYTSGTTGQPKGALHGHRVLAGHVPGVQYVQGFLPEPGDLMWTPADWAWAGGLLNALLPSLSLGVPVVSARHEKFDPEEAWQLMASLGVRNAFFAPTALKMMRQVPSPRGRFDLRLRSIGAAGEALGSETYDWARAALGLPIDEFYGQTECNIVLGSCSALGVSRAGAIGRATPGHVVGIIDDEGREVPRGAQGQIAIAAPDPVMFLNYWNQPEATAAKFLGRWMITGDTGIMDADGYVHFVGRDDDVITSAAYRIGPAEIEDCLAGHPDVALAAVVGKPDPVRTEIVKAYVKLAPGVAPSEELAARIKAHVRERLSAHEYPREVAFVDDIPLTTSGKVIRRFFRDAARTEAARERG